MEMKIEKGRAMPDWMVDHFNSGDIILAIKRKLHPNWGGKGSKESLTSPTIKKQKYSWAELRRTPKGILAVLAWEFEVRKADFKDAAYTVFTNDNGTSKLETHYKLTELLMSDIKTEEE